MQSKRVAAEAGNPTSREIKKTAMEEVPAGATAEQFKDAAINISLVDLEERVADVTESWETDSLLEDALQELSEDSIDGTPEADNCTPEEAVRLRRELRELGPAIFCQRTVDAGLYTAKKLLSAFGIRPPLFLEGQPDESYFSLLSLAMTRELSKRVKLAKYNTVDDAVDLLNRSQNIILITGAGISTSLGIPDFRSKGTGLYSKLEHLGLSDPQEVFDIDTFKDDPSIFYSIAKDIIPDSDRYTPTHRFIAMLNERGKLLTNYSQNIDNLEIKAGIPRDKLIQCHGSFGTASCIKCGCKTQGENIFPDIKAGNIPRCQRCIQNLRTNGASIKRRRPNAASKKKKKRQGWTDDSSDDDSEYDIPTAGVMKPDITFFGEALPDEFSHRLTEHDRDKVDLVVVIGTSLKVTPVSEIVSWLPPHVPQMYISREAVKHVNFDIDLLGDCDVVVAELCRRLAWPLAHEMVPEDQKVTLRVEEGYASRHIFEEQKASVEALPSTATAKTAATVATTTIL